ncbi:MAG TPA: hypothetical protein EYP04_09065 [Anaerolineae bacterium]|nr:hypothetical protein [Anaerolineae bacterium]HIQ05646.1 hypothetical protein [Anaerolineae bacterium]
MNDTADRIAANAGWNVLGLGVTALITFLLTPVLLHGLGSARFGIWALIRVVSAYVGLADLGLPRAVVKAVAERRAAGDVSGLLAVANTAGALYLLTAGVTATGLLLARSWVLTSLLRVPAPFWAEAAAAYTWAVVAFELTLLAGFLAAVLEGLQCMVVTNAALSAGRIAFVVGALLAVTRGGGLSGIAFSAVLGAALQLTINTVLLHRLLPQLRWQPTLVQRTEARWMLKFGVQLFLINLVAILFIPLSKLLLAAYGSLTGVAAYEVAASISQQLFLFFWAWAAALYPAAAAAQAAGNRERVAMLYRRGLRYFLLAGVPLASGMVLFARPFVALWLGPGHEQIAWALGWLAAAWGVVILALPVSAFSQALGRPWLALMASASNGVINLVLASLLAALLGFPGVVLGNVVAMIGSSLLMLWLFQRSFRPDRQRILETLPWQTALVVLLFSVLVYPFLARADLAHPLRLALAGASWLLVVIGLTGGFTSWRPEERRWLWRRLPAGLSQSFAFLAPGQGSKTG